MMSEQIRQYRIPLTPKDDVPLAMPSGARVLNVAADPNSRVHVLLSAWVDVDAEEVVRHFHLLGSGMDIKPGYRYVSTAINTLCVWHLFERQQGPFFGGGI
jgi:hypothetical protein